jgi:hypothetical protein
LKNYRKIGGTGASYLSGLASGQSQGGGDIIPASGIITHVLELVKSDGSSRINIPLPQHNYNKNSIEFLVKFIGPIEHFWGTMNLTTTSGTAVTQSEFKIYKMYITFGSTAVPFNYTDYDANDIQFTSNLMAAGRTVVYPLIQVAHSPYSGNLYTSSTPLNFNEVCIFYDLYTDGSTSLARRFLVQRFVLDAYHTISTTYNTPVFTTKILI